MSMKCTVTAAALGISALCAGGLAVAQSDGGLLAAENFSNTIYITTDYVFRGVSFTDEDPAIQGSFDYAHPSGAYLGVWGSNWDGFGSESELELDYYGGYANAAGPIDYDVTALYYTFPGADDEELFAGAELDYFEAHVGLSHTVEAIPFTPTIGVGYNYSPDYNGSDGDSHYVSGSLDFVLPADIGLSLGVGHLDVSGDELGALVSRPDGFAYTHYQIGVSKAIRDFNFGVTYHETSSDCKNEYGAPYYASTDVCTPAAVFTVSRTF